MGSRDWTTEEGAELRTLVQLVGTYGVYRLLEVLQGASRGEEPGVRVVSTVHRAKGREWPCVQLADDFVRHDEPLDSEEARLFYVAMTRAQDALVADPAIMSVFTTGAWRRSRGEDLPDDG